MTLLICDLGGTNCRLALATQSRIVDGSLVRLRNDDYSSFPELLRSYLRQINRKDSLDVVIAMAAPVVGDRIRLTNRDWYIDKDEVAGATNAKSVSFLNDFQALGLALSTPESLRSSALFLPSAAPIQAPRIIMGAGTGFGCAVWLPCGTVVCTEAGHTTFPVETEFDQVLTDYLSDSSGRCSLEWALSGSGIHAAYIVSCRLSGRPPRLEAAKDIAEAGLDGMNPDASRACHEFARMLGRSAGDLALLFLARGGVYLSASATRSIRPLMEGQDSPFRQAFRSKGRLACDMDNYSIHLLADDDGALQGCINWHNYDKSLS